MGVSSTTFYRNAKSAVAGHAAQNYGNTGLHKPKSHTVVATATLGAILDSNADHMPHKTRVLPSGCCNTKTQVNPSSALNRTKHHQSNPSIVPGILDSNLSRRACMHSSKFLITWSNRITSYNRIRFFNRFPSFQFYYFPGLLNLCCTRQRGLPLLFREAGFTAPSGTYSGRRPTIHDLNLHTLIYF